MAVVLLYDKAWHTYRSKLGITRTTTLVALRIGVTALSLVSIASVVKQL